MTTFPSVFFFVCQSVLFVSLPEARPPPRLGAFLRPGLYLQLVKLLRTMLAFEHAQTPKRRKIADDHVECLPTKVASSEILLKVKWIP